MDDRIADGYMNPGYAIWRELAAETVAASIDFRPAYTLSDIRGNIESDVHELHVGNPVAKVVMVNLLTDVIFSREFDAGKWTKTESTLREMGIPFIGTIEKVSTQLRRKTFYCITPEQDKTDKSRRCKSSAFPCKKETFGPLVAHGSYTMNLCSANTKTRSNGLDMLRQDIARMEMLPGNLYNFHPGSHTGQGTETGITQIAEALNQVVTKDINTTILLETMAGKGSEIGGTFEELLEIKDGRCRKNLIIEHF